MVTLLLRILNKDFFVNINLIRNWQEDFKARFKDLPNMEILESIISSSDVEVESVNLNTFLKNVYTEMTFDLEGKSMYKFKEI